MVTMSTSQNDGRICSMVYMTHHITICCSDVVVELSREIILFGSEVLNNLWITLLEQLRINGLIVKEVFLYHISPCSPDKAC